MRSPLELPEGRFDHALLTTYSFSLRFFEEWVLRALWAAEVRNVVVFVDPHELGHALGDRAPSLAGRAYHLVAGAGARAAFHPKVLLLSGRERARLCVSSANLTPDGQLRNAESLIAFDWHLVGHQQPIRDAADFFRRLSDGAPAHTAAAIQHAISALPEADDEPSLYRFVHNLDDPLIEVFPPADSIRAIAPYVDADGTAARELHARGSLTVVVDGEQIAAAAEFFAAPWDVEARRFDARLHGKAYELTMPQGRWTLIGSPNLSEPALLEAAASGNLEVAIAVSESPPLELPASEPWDGEEVNVVAARRLAAARREREISGVTPRAFNAWEDERRIVVDGVPDGTRVERWSEERWHLLGTVSEGAILISDPEIRPTRIRALTPDGKLAFAVVAQPALLRARMRARSRGRQTESVEHLPLDVETVRVLEQALSDLYALSELAGEVRIQRPPVRTASEQTPSLLEWKPRNPEEEPRIPPLYKRNWKGEPDALVALVGRVLRLEPNLHPVSEADVAREQIEVEAVGDVTSEEELQGEQPPAKEPPKVRTQRDELERYRRAFLRLFERGQEFIKSAPEPDLASLAFTYLERLIEELGFHHVVVDDQDEPLMTHPTLRNVNLDLLDDYLGRGEHDPLCLATARAHLAVAIRELRRYSARDRERVEDLAYKWAAELIAVPTEIPTPSREHLGVDPLSAAAWLDAYAARSDWRGIEREAASRLGAAWLERAPFPTIVGEASFAKRTESPAWALLAFAAPAGFASRQQFAVAVRNDADSPTALHVLVCSPIERFILEAWLRTTDGHWLEQRYRAPTQSVVENMGGPFMLERVRSVTEHASLDNVDAPLKALAPLLEDVIRVFS